MPFESLIETKNSTSCDLGFPGSLFCCSNTPLGCLLLSQTQTSDKQKTHPNPFSQRIGFEYELYGGELGTRTPDPLRVMHNDFSFFRTMIRQIGSICYRSATNQASSSNKSHCFWECNTKVNYKLLYGFPIILPWLFYIL